MPGGPNNRNIEGRVGQEVATFQRKADSAKAEDVKKLALELAEKIKRIAEEENS